MPSVMQRHFHANTAIIMAMADGYHEKKKHHITTNYPKGPLLQFFLNMTKETRGIQGNNHWSWKALPVCHSVAAVCLQHWKTPMSAFYTHKHTHAHTNTNTRRVQIISRCPIGERHKQGNNFGGESYGVELNQMRDSWLSVCLYGLAITHTCMHAHFDLPQESSRFHTISDV